MDKPINHLECHVFWLKNTMLKSWILSDKHRQEYEDEIMYDFELLK